MRHARPEPTSARPSLRRRAAVVSLAAGLALTAAVGTASAKEVTSGGTPATPAGACNPVSSLSYKGDATTSDTGVGTVRVSYGVKSCDGAAVTARLAVVLSANLSVSAYDDAVPLSGKVTAVVTRNTSYIAKVDVFDAASGALVGSRQIYVAAVYKGV